MSVFSGSAHVTDGSGQSASAPVTITQVPKLSIAVNVTPASGPPGTAFRIDTQITGGQAPFNITLDPINGVQPTPIPGAPGSFTVTP